MDDNKAISSIDIEEILKVYLVKAQNIDMQTISMLIRLTQEEYIALMSSDMTTFDWDQYSDKILYRKIGEISLEEEQHIRLMMAQSIYDCLYDEDTFEISAL